jgi:hypothetical protein
VPLLSSRRPEDVLLLGLTISGMFAAMAAALLVVRRPPKWLKPTWIQLLELRQPMHENKGRGDHVEERLFLVGGLLCALLSVLFLIGTLASAEMR